MGLNLSEMFARMERGEVAAHSELGTRDESKQTRNFDARIRKMKTAVGLRGHALVMKDLVIEFNPFTCEADEVYNSKTPFRPILLVSQVIEGLKGVCAKNPELAAKWNDVLGIEEGDIDWNGPVTHGDYLHFKHAGMVEPRVMTYFTVTARFNGLNGFSEYPTKFLVDASQLNENYTYDYENAPVWHKLASLFFAIIRPELDSVTEKLKRNNADKNTITNERSRIKSQSPLTYVTPTNLIPFLYFPLDEVPRTFDAKNVTEIEQSMHWMSLNKDKWGTAMSEAAKDDSFDEHIDFFDFTLKTPQANETKSNGQVYTDDDALDLYKAMTVQNTDARFSIVSGKTKDANGNYTENKKLYDEVTEAAKRYFTYSQEQSGIEGGDTFEKIMAASNGFRPITSVQDRMLSAANQIFTDKFAKSPHFTEDVRRANSEALIAMNPANSIALAAEDDEDLEEAARDQAASLKELMIEAAKEGDSIGDEDAPFEIVEVEDK